MGVGAPSSDGGILAAVAIDSMGFAQLTKSECIVDLETLKFVQMTP